MGTHHGHPQSWGHCDAGPPETLAIYMMYEVQCWRSSTIAAQSILVGSIDPSLEHELVGQIGGLVLEALGQLIGRGRLDQEPAIFEGRKARFVGRLRYWQRRALSLRTVVKGPTERVGV
jgi:hypothetical protein